MNMFDFDKNKKSILCYVMCIVYRYIILVVRREKLLYNKTTSLYLYTLNYIL